MSQVQQVKAAVDIVELIGERIELKQSGSNFRALCPFHSESSPSFFVSPVIQRYRCFGCGETGDVFTFLEKYDGMTFAEALEALAQRAGIELQDYRHSPQDELRQRLLEVNSLTQAYYHYLLTEHSVGRPAREYLATRGVTQESIKLFQLGYSLPSWDGLIKYLHQKKKFTISDLEEAGLVIKGKGGRHYDRFRGRLMFPLTNHRSQVVGFSGRILDADAKEAKYINSPETMLYHKSELLFGYSQLYQQIRKEEEVVVVEGELDVISSVQAHQSNVVAIKGSALTREQLQLLRRTVKKVLLSLDMDAAGVEATKRAITLALEFDLELRVVQLPGGKDPDELARQQPKQWREAVKSSISVYEFFVRRALADHDPESPEGKRLIIDDLAPIINQIKHAVEQDFYIKKIADAINVKATVVKQDFDRLKDTKKLGVNTAAAARDKSAQPKAKPAAQTRQHRLEEYLAFLWLRLSEKGNLWQRISLEQPLLQLIEWQTPELKHIFSTILTDTPQLDADPLDTASYMATLPEDIQSMLSDAYLNPEYTQMLDTDIDLQLEWQQTVRELTQLSVKHQTEEISRQLSKLDQIQDKTPEQEVQHTELLQKVVELKRFLA